MIGGMDSNPSKAVVVGIDGSATSDAALQWAASEASARGLRLHVFSAGTCHADGMASAYSDADVHAVTRAALGAAVARLAAAEDLVRGSAPGLVVTTQSGLDRADDTLVELSARAQSVVVGRSGHGPVTGAVLGSVVSRLVTRAECPVVVVHESSATPTGQSGVAVGVDLSPGCIPALAHAFEEASVRGVRLHVIHARWTRASAATPDTQADQLAQERVELAELLAGWAEQYPDVDVRVSTPVGPTVLALTDAARGAELLVVGSRGHGPVLNALLGSVSRGVLRHAPCTVTVVRSPGERPGRTVTFGTARRTPLAAR